MYIPFKEQSILNNNHMEMDIVNISIISKILAGKKILSCLFFTFFLSTFYCLTF